MTNSYSLTDIIKLIFYSIITIGILLTALASIGFIITFALKNVLAYTLCSFLMMVLAGMVSLGLLAVTQFNTTMKQLVDSKVIPMKYYEIKN